MSFDWDKHTQLYRDASEKLAVKKEFEARWRTLCKLALESPEKYQDEFNAMDALLKASDSAYLIAAVEFQQHVKTFKIEDGVISNDQPDQT